MFVLYKHIMKAYVYATIKTDVWRELRGLINSRRLNIQTNTHIFTTSYLNSLTLLFKQDNIYAAYNFNVNA